MNVKSSLLYAKKLLFEKNASHGKRTLVGAVVCIAISLVPLVAVLSISDGMISGITGRIIGLSSQDISVSLSSDESFCASASSFQELSDRLLQVEGVVASVPEVQGTALAVGDSSRSGATVRAVPEDVFEKNIRFKTLFEVVEGEASLSRSRSAVIGSKLANDLGLHAGDSIRLITINTVGDEQSSRVLPKVTVLTVSGIVSCGYQELDALWVFVPLSLGFSILPSSSSQYSIALVTEDSFSPDIATIAYRVQQDLYGTGGGSFVESAAVYLWNELNSAQYENFASTKVLLLLIMLLIVLVASINISSALIMLVMERKKEIAILKSLGSTKAEVSLSFLVAGFAAGSGGVLVGIPLGLLAAVNINRIIAWMEKTVNVLQLMLNTLLTGEATVASEIHLLDPAYYLQNIPVTIPCTELLVIAVGTLLLSLLASTVPAIRAGREKPIDTLRKM